MDQMDRMEKMLTEVHAKLHGVAPATPAQGGYVHPGPDGLAIVGGVALRLDEPIRADWEPSLEAYEITRADRIGSDPSNAFDSGLPKRSPAGYPMAYGVGAHGPVVPGRVKFGDTTHDDDAAVEQYKIDRANQGQGGGSFSPGRP